MKIRGGVHCQATVTAESSKSVPERRIVLFGNTGHGKSSSRNTILEEGVFVTAKSHTYDTDEPIKRDAVVKGRNITVIETPGFGSDCDEKTKSEILKGLIECAPGVDGFIMILKLRRYNKHEMEVIENLLNTFKQEEVLKHTVILFTFGERLKGQSIEQFVRKSPQLQELVDQCGGRCHVIDNKHWKTNESGYKSNRVQVKNLLDTIDKMVKENGRYSNELLKMAEEEIQEEMMKMRNKNLTSEEKRDQAKTTVCNRWLQAVGAFTGFIFGALLGLVVAVAFIFLVFSQLKRYLSLFGLGEAAVPSSAAAVNIVAAIIFGAALIGGLGGAVTGWKAAEEADSVYDAMIKAAQLNYENVKAVVEKIIELVESPFKYK